VQAIFLWGHSGYVNYFPNLQRRDSPGGNTLRLEGEGQPVFQITVPSHGLFFLAVSINNNLIFDAVFPAFISFQVRHSLSLPGQILPPEDVQVNHQPEVLA
jgi:hypothetical protein